MMSIATTNCTLKPGVQSVQFVVTPNHAGSAAVELGEGRSRQHREKLDNP